ncbi:MAG: hypothetical protein AAGD11_06730 [Planctomycetota bacterium]
MSTATLPHQLPKPVGRKVRLLRWLVRGYVLVDGMAAIAVVCGLAFWIALAIDWLLEPTPVTRVLMWLIAAIIAAAAARRYLVGPLTTRLTDTNLALLLERSFPDLKQGLITTVEAANRRQPSPTSNQSLLLHTSSAAEQALRGKSLSEVFQFGPILRKTTIAGALATSIAFFAFLQPEAFGFWLERIQLGEQPWPRRVQLSVMGFEETDGRLAVNVARDDDFELQVLASLLDDHVSPDLVEIRYRQPDGRRGRFPLTRIGDALVGRDESQLFRYEFKKVSASLDFDLVGGDDRVRDLRLNVVERPQIVRMLFECKFPAYLNRTPQTIPVSGRVEVPEGTEIVCRLESNKPLRSAHVHDPLGQVDLAAQLSEENRYEVTLPFQIDQEDRVLLITLLDTDGVENREPFRVIVGTVLDQPPEVAVQLRGIGSAITAQAKIPLSGTITDEYGVEQLWFEYRIDKNPPENQMLSSQPAGRRELSTFEHFDLSLTDQATNRPIVDVAPGKQFTLSLHARDSYDLDDQRQAGASQRFVLDVVTESELRALLEKKELALRQRFESIYEKTLGTRELLDRIQSPSNGPGDSSTDESAAERDRERDRLRVTGALQNVVQLSYETLGVADGMEDIVSELVNNRVNSEELTERLMQGIAEPLREIGGELMPELERRLQQLQSSFSEDATTGDQALSASKLQGDLVLDAMKRVLDRMLELESYNELVELLRGIVADQLEIQQETKQKRKEKLRSLLED